MQNFNIFCPSGPTMVCSGKPKTSEILWEFFTIQHRKFHSNPDERKPITHSFKERHNE